MCHVNRSRGELGLCRSADNATVAWAGLHRGEEPPLTGKNGSGTIFFTGCTLHCPYCQNIQISGVEKESIGYEMSTAELALLMMDLKEMGAHTLNLITGTHYIPSIIAALEEARKMGFDLPVVWNSSGYERIEALSLIDPYIDIYLLDCKTLSHSVASRFCSTSRYADVIIPVMDYVKKTHPVTDFDKMRGTLLRHLVFPGTVNETLSFLEYYSRNYKSSFFLSLMVQFVPPRSGITFDKITEEEYDTLVSALEYYEIDDGFIQELGDEDKWIPDFRKDVPFPSPFATASPYFLSVKRR